MKKDQIAYWIIFLAVSFGTAAGLVHFANAITEENGHDFYLSSVSLGNHMPPTTQETPKETPADVVPAGNPHVIFKTSLGTIELELFKDKAPNTVANFLKLTAEKFYDGTRFHRVIKDFMIQGGDPLSKDATKRELWGRGGPGYTFADEINDQKLVRGVLAMANAGPNTNGSQFFIVTLDATPWLDGHHTAFGKVISGMDVVDKIEHSQVNHDAGDQPVVDISLESVTVK